MSCSESKIILLTGMHRSGTSLLAQLLGRAGGHLGGPLDTDPDAFNETGHWEHRGIVAVQEQLLIDFGREWHVTGNLELPQGWLQWPETAAARRRISEIAKCEFGESNHWIVKDPRTIRLLPLWRQVASDLGVSCRVIACVRDPREVAASLVHRNGMDRDLALDIWLASYRDLLSHAFSAVKVVSYDDSMADAAGTLREISVFCGLNLSEHKVREAATAVRPDLRHHRIDDGGERGEVPDKVTEIYRRVIDDGAASEAEIGMGETEGDASQDAEVLVVMRTSWRDLFLPRGVRSVLAQTYTNWHLHIVNDGGPPAWVENAVMPYRAALGERVVVRHLHPGRGMEAASNEAIARGRGRYIVIHDDDDSWHPCFLERTVGFLEHSGGAAVAAKAMWIEEETTSCGIRRRDSREFGPDTESVSREELLIENRFPTIALVFRRSVAEEIGPFREEMLALGDWEFNLRLAELGPLHVLDAYLANWHRRSPSDPTPNSPDRDHRRFARIIDNVRRREQDLDVFELGPEVLQLESGAGLDEAFEKSSVVELEPVAHRAAERVADGWMATGDDPQLDLHWEGEPLGPGLFLLVFDMRLQEDTGEPQLFYRWDGPHSEMDSIRLEPAEAHRYAFLLNVQHGLSELRLDPMDHPGWFTLSPPRLARLCDPVSGLTRFNRKAGFPGVLCIGAQRSGTTWLWKNLNRHPRIWTPPVKEAHFFDSKTDPTRWQPFRQRAAIGLIGATAEMDVVEWAVDFGFSPRRDEQWYSRLFDDAPDPVTACDMTPAYAILDEAEVARVADLMPAARVIFLLRDPVERAISGALHELKVRGVATTDEEEIRREVASDGVTDRSDYRKTIERWERHFPAEQLGLFFFDDLQRDPLGTLSQITEFLGLEFDASWFPDAAHPINRGAVDREGLDLAPIRTELSVEFMPQLEWLSQRLGGWADEWLKTAQARLHIS